MQLHRILPGILPTKKYPVSIVLMCKVVLHFHSNSKGLSAILLISLMLFIMLCKVITPVWLSNHTVGTFPWSPNLNNTSLKVVKMIVQTVKHSLSTFLPKHGQQRLVSRRIPMKILKFRFTRNPTFYGHHWIQTFIVLTSISSGGFVASGGGIHRRQARQIFIP